MRQREEAALGCSQKTPPREGLGRALTAGRGGRAGAPVSTEGLSWGTAPLTVIQGFSWRVVFNRCHYHLEPDMLVIIFLGFILSPGSAIRGLMCAS